MGSAFWAATSRALAAAIVSSLTKFEVLRDPR
jgi:hypothetical protein